MWIRCELTIDHRFEVCWFRTKEEMDCFLTSFTPNHRVKIRSRKEVETRCGKSSTDPPEPRGLELCSIEESWEQVSLPYDEEDELTRLEAEEAYYDPEVDVDDYWPSLDGLDDLIVPDDPDDPNLYY